MSKLNKWMKQGSEAALGVVGTLPEILRAIHGSYGQAGPEQFNERLKQKQHSESLISVFCLLLVILVAVIDGFYAPKISFTLFYVLIVALGSWGGGRKTGVFIAFMCLLALFVHEVRAWDEHSSTKGAFFGNLGVQLGIYLFVALLVSAVRNLTENLEGRVFERTAALEREIAERNQTEEQLRKTTQQFRQLAENIADAFWMRDAGEMRMAYVSPAYEKIWGRTCKSLYLHPNAWLEAIHPEDRDRVAQAVLTKQSAGEYSQEYRIVRTDGTLRWIRDRAGKVQRIVGIAEDVTDRKRLEREILEISDREQARIGQDLHDSLCQKLVSLAFDNNSLERKLANRALPEAATAQQIAAVLDDVITEARGVARGLFPVQLETDGLGVALEQLAATVSARARVSCRLECPQPVSLRDNVVATHLYRIAQEAVNNAIKHGQAKSIVVRLIAEGDSIELSVTDDGVGLPETTASDGLGGMGMHIMDYRARTIGGTLSVRRGEAGGTVVSCVMRQPEA
jgi:PAS domain S-box-containing protein